MRKVIIILLSMVLFVAGCAKAPAVQPTMSPENVVEAYLQASSEGNVDTCLSLLADDVAVRQEPSGINVSGKTQLEVALRQLLTWHHQYSVVGPMKIEGDKVKLTIKETGDEYQIMGLEYITGDLEVQVYDGKIKSWTGTVNQEDWKRLTELTAGGIGVKVDFVEQGMRVNEAVGNSPAYESGVRQGDIIIAVNGVNYSQMRDGEMQLRIKGPVGSKVKLTITHEGAPAPVEVEVTRVALEQLKY